MMKKKSKKTVLFVYSFWTPFIARDLRLLEKNFNVIRMDFSKKGLTSIIKLIKYLLRSEISISRFAGWHAAAASVISRLLNKKSVVIVGGTDAACIPKIGYGVFTTLKGKVGAKLTYRYVDLILPISDFLKECLINNVGGHLISKIRVIQNAFDYKDWVSGNTKENIVLTVSHISRKRIKTKGLDTFVKTARYLPNTKFVLIGGDLDGSLKELQAIAPQNVEFIGPVPHEKILLWYQKAKVYCQLSLFEGFGNALGEAMLCECIPVVTNSSELPNIIGNCGFIVPYASPKITANAIQKALRAPVDLGKKCRKKIIQDYPIEKRERELISIIQKLVG